jgi:hypothetical protein
MTPRRGRPPDDPAIPPKVQGEHHSPAWARDNELSDDERAYVSEYLVDFNRQDAMQRIWPDLTRQAAANKAHRLHKTDRILKAIDQAMTERGYNARTMIIDELAAIINADITDFIKPEKVGGALTLSLTDWEALPLGATKLVKSLRQDKDGRIRIELHDKLAALKMLAEARGVGLHEPSGSLGNTIEQLIRAAAGKKVSLSVDATVEELEPPPDVPTITATVQREDGGDGNAEGS